MKRQRAFISAIATMIAVVCWSVPQRALSQTNNGDAVKRAYVGQASNSDSLSTVAPAAVGMKSP
jgi:hypothetical protein